MQTFQDSKFECLPLRLYFRQSLHPLYKIKNFSSLPLPHYNLPHLRNPDHQEGAHEDELSGFSFRNKLCTWDQLSHQENIHLQQI